MRSGAPRKEAGDAQPSRWTHLCGLADQAALRAVFFWLARQRKERKSAEALYPSKATPDGVAGQRPKARASSDFRLALGDDARAFQADDQQHGSPRVG
jgi:hypothetical protein